MRRNLLAVGALIVIGVLLMVVFSATGQRPFDAPSEEEQTEQEEVPPDVVTPAGTLDHAGTLEDQ